MSVQIINEHEYDDEMYTEAANGCVDEVSECLNALWRAGGGIEDIESELTNALHNSDIIDALDCKVVIEKQ